MLKNMKVRNSLLMGYIITIVISVVIIFAILTIMSRQSSSYDGLMEREVTANQTLLQVRNYCNIAARNLRDILLIPDDPMNPKMEARIHEVLEEVDALTAQLEKTYPDNIDRADLDTYLTKVDNWQATLVSILNMYNAGDINGAIRKVSSDCTPALNDMAVTAIDLSARINDSIDQREKEISGNTNKALIAVVIAMIIAAICVMYLAIKIIKSIAAPTAEVHEALIGFSQGKLDIPVTYESNNELGEMCAALRTSQRALGSVIQEESYLLGEMAKGNFDLRFQDESIYVGAMLEVKEAMTTINQKLSDTLTQINLSAEQVSAGSEQVSTGAQALAQGATQQASAVEELSATIQEISNNAKENAKRSEEALERANYTGDRVDESAEHMEEMVQAMGRISDSSQEISKIIATIENIAFQTNILALNAAVEAARAGSAGKGFAVVADEVRNLSAKSDQAAKATKELIDRSIASVQDGNTIVSRVSESLQKTVDATNQLKNSIDEIAKAVENEAEAIVQVTDGIEQISCVVQTNSATSEESAATSEELSSQASMMRSLMSQFKLRTTEQELRFGGAPDTCDYGADNEQDGFPGVSSTAFSKY